MINLAVIDSFCSLLDGGQKIAFPTITLKSGTCVLLLGINGAGKSTFLKHIAQSLSNLEISFSYVGHEHGLIMHMSVQDHLSLYQRSSNDLFLNFKPESLISELSAGQRQLLSLNLRTHQKNALWLLDEPLTHLDQNIKKSFVEILLKHLSGGGSVVMSSHEKQFLEKLNPVEIFL